MNRNKIAPVIGFVCLAAGMAWGIYWLAVATYYCAPNVEDFSLAIRPREQGLLPSVVNLLVSYDSRYTDAFLHGLNPLAFNRPQYFVLMPVLCFLFFTGSFYFFITSFITGKQNRWLLTGYALLFVITHYATETQLPCGLFLMVSTFNYIYPWFFAFIWAGALLRTFNEPVAAKRVLLSVLGYTALILSYGCTEFFISINGFVLLALFLYALVYDKPKLKYIIPYCAVAVSCVVFILLCPSQKMVGGQTYSSLSVRYPGSNFIIESARVYAGFILHYLLHPLSVCFVFVTTLIFRQPDISNRLKFNFSQRQLLLLFAGAVLISYITTWVFFIPIGKSGFFPRYTFNSIQILAQLGLYVFLPLYLSKLSVSGNTFSIPVQPVVAFLFLVLLVFSPNNISEIKAEYHEGIVQQVKNKAEQFYARVNAEKKRNPERTIVYFENPPVTPQTNYFGPDVMPNRQAPWWNIAYEGYFKVDEVRLQGDTIFK